MLTELLEKYKDKKPMDLKTATERVYPVSAVIDMMIEFAQHKLEVQQKEVEKIVDLKETFKN